MFPAAWTDGFTEGGIPEGTVIQLDPALDNVQKAIQLKPRLAMAHNLRGIIFEKRDDFGEAVASYATPYKGAYDADFGLEVGGPIAKDRLWFYAGVAAQLQYFARTGFTFSSAMVRAGNSVCAARAWASASCTATCCFSRVVLF